MYHVLVVGTPEFIEISIVNIRYLNFTFNTNQNIRVLSIQNFTQVSRDKTRNARCLPDFTVAVCPTLSEGRSPNADTTYHRFGEGTTLSSNIGCNSIVTG